MNLHLEALEGRDLPSVAIQTSLGGALLGISVLSGPENVLVRPTPNVPGSIDVVYDGTTQSFMGVQTVNFFNFDSSAANTDYFTNRTTLSGNLSVFSPAATVIYTIAPGSIILGGTNGNNVIQATGGNSLIQTFGSNNSVYGGPGDRISVGTGTNNTVYDILPGNTFVNVDPHTGVDHLFTGPQTTLTGAQPQDHTAQFFVAGRTQGSGTLVQQGSTLYFTGNNNGDYYEAFPLGAPGSVFVVYNLNNGAGYQTASFFGVNQLANFGGAGADNFINNTSIDDVQYGAGGSNLLIGGTGQLDLEKAGGAAATGSTAIGRSAVANDLNGSGLTNTSNTLIFLDGGTATNIARTNSPTDTVIGLKTTDFLVSLYPDNVIAAFLPPFVPA